MKNKLKTISALVLSFCMASSCIGINAATSTVITPDTDITDIPDSAGLSAILTDTDINTIFNGTDFSGILTDADINDILNGSGLSDILPDDDINDILNGTDISGILDSMLKDIEVLFSDDVTIEYDESGIPVFSFANPDDANGIYDITEGKQIIDELSAYLSENYPDEYSEMMNSAEMMIRQYTGDINADGIADITDLTELALMIIGDTGIPENIAVEDINDDGKISLPDLAAFKQYLSKQIDSFTKEYTVISCSDLL